MFLTQVDRIMSSTTLPGSVSSLKLGSDAGREAEKNLGKWLWRADLTGMWVFVGVGRVRFLETTSQVLRWAQEPAIIPTDGRAGPTYAAVGRSRCSSFARGREGKGPGIGPTVGRANPGPTPSWSIQREQALAMPGQELARPRPRNTVSVCCPMSRSCCSKGSGSETM